MLLSLDIGNCDIGTETLIALATVMKTNTTLQELNIENARVFSRQEDSTCVTGCSVCLPVLRCRDVFGGIHTGCALRAACCVGPWAPRLTVCCASGAWCACAVLAPCRYHLCRMLQVNKTLAAVNLSKHKVVDFGAELLAEHIEGSTTLFSLTLRR